MSVWRLGEASRMGQEAELKGRSRRREEARGLYARIRPYDLGKQYFALPDYFVTQVPASSALVAHVVTTMYVLSVPFTPFAAVEINDRS